MNLIEINSRGHIIYYNKIGLKHRSGGKPAIKNVEGLVFYYENNLRHRANDLPAIEYYCGEKYYYKHGKQYYPEIMKKEDL